MATLGWLFDRVKGVFSRGKTTVGPAAQIGLRNAFADGAGTNAADLGRRLAAKEVTLKEFQAALFAETRSAFIAQYALGRGGIASFTDADRTALEEMLGRQLGYLREFSRAIATNTMTADAIVQRAALYPLSAAEAHSRGAAAARGIDVPIHPPVHPNCHCSWRYESDGAHWQTDAEPCPTCVDFAAQYNPWTG